MSRKGMMQGAALVVVAMLALAPGAALAQPREGGAAPAGAAGLWGAITERAALLWGEIVDRLGALGWRAAAPGRHEDNLTDWRLKAGPACDPGGAPTSTACPNQNSSDVGPDWDPADATSSSACSEASCTDEGPDWDPAG